MRKIYLIILIISFGLGCNTEKQVKVSIENICNCYSSSDTSGFDKKLESCLIEFNKNLNKDKADFELFNVVKQLIQSCPNYQIDFNQVILNRYSNRNKEDIEERKDSVLALINNNISILKNLSILAELEILQGNYNQALEITNKAIKIDPDKNYAYWIRAFIYHKISEYDKAIKDCKTIIKISKSKEMKNVAELWILNLEAELKTAYNNG